MTVSNVTRYNVSRTYLLRLMRSVARTTEVAGYTPDDATLERCLDTTIALAPNVGEVVTIIEGEDK